VARAYRQELVDIVVRVDAGEAARTCDAVAAEVSSWTQENAIGRG